MIISLIKMLGRSPFAPLKAHMDKVKECVMLVPSLIDAVVKGDEKNIAKIANEISHLEHQADLTKNDIRNHLPSNVFLPVDRQWLLEVLELQDKLADHAEDLAVIFQIRPLAMSPKIHKEFFLFVDKNIETFNEFLKISVEIHDLIESSFGGVEAEKVRELTDQVSLLEHEADVLQIALIKKFYALEEEMSYATFDLWKSAIGLISSFSNLSENLSNKVRMALYIR